MFSTTRASGGGRAARCELRLELVDLGVLLPQLRDQRHAVAWSRNPDAVKAGATKGFFYTVLHAVSLAGGVF